MHKVCELDEEPAGLGQSASESPASQKQLKRQQDKSAKVIDSQRKVTAGHSDVQCANYENASHTKRESSSSMQPSWPASSAKPAPRIPNELMIFQSEQIHAASAGRLEPLGAPLGQATPSATLKKGVLWEQLDSQSLHRRLFGRWKRRYFVLTADYLVCFKCAKAKVGRSEMGKFIYKVSLGPQLSPRWVALREAESQSIFARSSKRAILSRRLGARTAIWAFESAAPISVTYWLASGLVCLAMHWLVERIASSSSVAIHARNLYSKSRFESHFLPLRSLLVSILFIL